MRSTPLQRAARRLRLKGYAIEVTRKRTRRGRHTPHAFLDLLAFHPDRPPLAVFVAEAAAGAPDRLPETAEAVAHVAVRTLPRTRAVLSWLARGCQLQVWFLGGDGPRRRKRWQEIPIGVISAADDTAPASAV
jgi:hypothetical protein